MYFPLLIQNIKSCLVLKCIKTSTKIGIFSLRYKSNLKVILGSKSETIKNIKARQKLGTVNSLLSPHLQAEIADTPPFLLSLLSHES